MHLPADLIVAVLRVEVSSSKQSNQQDDGSGSDRLNSARHVGDGRRYARPVEFKNLALLEGKRLTLLLMGTSPKGEDDWAAFAGTARLDDGTLYLDRDSAPAFEIRPEWIERIVPVEPALRETLLGADYYLPLTVGNRPSADGEGLLPTGLKWPSGS
jgi:hypothetical protein